mgnify:CR=1 FL=1
MNKNQPIRCVVNINHTNTLIINNKYKIFLEQFFTLLFSFKQFIFLFLIFSVTGCSISPSKNTQTFSSLNDVSHWQARGKVLLKNKDNKVSGNFFWQQKDKNFTLSLNSFIGTNILTLKSDNGLTTLEVDGKKYKDTDPELLVYRVTGQQIPVKTLADWMLALVASNNVNSNYVNDIEYFEENKNLRSFSYQLNEFSPKWQVTYMQYQVHQGLTIPSDININTKKDKIKLSINSWEFIR